MSDALALVFDVGTQSLRGLLISPEGRVVQMAQDVYEQPYYSLRPNWAEQKPDYYFEHMCAVSQRLKDRAPEDFARARAVALTAFRDSMVCLGADGRPLRDCILWLDQRQAASPKPLPAALRSLFALAGMSETVELLQRTAACNWLAENEPALWEATDKYVCLSTYLNYRLTGRLADSWASAQAKIPFDYKNRRWDEHGITRRAYDIPNDKLFELLPSGTVIGEITPEAARLTGIPQGLPLIATASDKACETIGLSVIREDQAALSFGTSCTVQLITGRYVEPSPFMPAYPALPNDMYNPEIQLFRGYWMLSWFKQNFAQPETEAAKYLNVSAEELLDRHLSEIPPGSNGLMVLPHWAPGLATPAARGAMIGFTDNHTKYHIYRALIEGVNYGLMEGLRGMEKRSGQRVKELFLGGGGSRSAAVCQITADMFGLPVSRIQTTESSALGAAVCVFIALGEYADYPRAVAGMVHTRDAFQPDAARSELYDRLYREVYRKLSPSVTPLHRLLRDLTGRSADPAISK